MKEIKDIEIGEQVLTFNEVTKGSEYKKVLKTPKYPIGGDNHYHKMITFVMQNGEKFCLTPNHEIYDNGNWIASGEYAKRVLEGNRWNRWSISNLNNGKSSIKKDLWEEEPFHFKALFDQERIFENLFQSKREKTNADTPISCFSFFREQGEQTNCEPYKLQSLRQSIREFGMGNRQGECKSFKRTLSSVIRYTWRKCLELKANGNKSIRDTQEIYTKSLYKGYVSGGIQCKSINDKGCDTPKELDSRLIKEIHYGLKEGYVYDLTVADNHNYCLNESNTLIHNSGKSFIGCSLICADALMYPKTHYFIARKTLSDLRKFTTPSIQEVMSIWGIGEEYYSFNGQDNYFKFHNGSKIFLIDAKYLPSDPNYMRFGSMQMTRGFIEEAGEFDIECKNNLQASIGRWMNKEYNLTPKLLQTCNPSKNYLYKDYYKPNTEGTLPSHMKFIQALPTDNKTLPVDYVPNLMKILSHNEVQRLVYGNWEFDDNPYAMFEYADILGIYTNEFVKPTQDRYMTCDIAYTGSDKFVIVVWAGFVATKIIAIDKIDDTMVSKKINELRIENRVPLKNVIYDADGLQTFTRASTKLGNLVGATPFNNNGKPIKMHGKTENFKNLKAQCYWYFAEAVKDSKMFIQEDKYRKQVIEELEQINRSPLQDDGKISLEKKEEIKKRIGRSPDFADSLMMRFFFELKGKPRLRIIW